MSPADRLAAWLSATARCTCPGCGGLLGKLPATCPQCGLGVPLGTEADYWRHHTPEEGEAGELV